MLDEVNVRLVRCLDDALELKRWLGERRPDGPLGLDTETTSANDTFPRLRLFQVGDAMQGWSVPAEDWRGLIREVVESWNGWWVMHNAKFDRQAVRRFVGAAPGPAHDTAILAHLKDPLARRALKDTAAREVDPRAAELDARLERQMAENKWDWSTVPVDFPTYWAYGALDPVLTVRCFDKLHEGRMAAGQKELYELELEAQLVAEKMEGRGVRVDVDYAREMETRLEERIDQLKDWAMEEYGFSLGSTSRVRDQLEYDGAIPILLTKSNVRSLSKHSIGHLDHPLAIAFLEKKALQVRAHTFFRNIYRYATPEGLVHCSINTLQAKTGRMSIGRPSLQNQPRSAEVRNAFLAREGHHLVAADFAQIELRILAHYAREQKMIELFLAGRDLPAEMARELGTERQTVKTSLYTLAYGGRVPRLAQSLGMAESDAAELLGTMEERYPDLMGFFGTLKDIAESRATEKDPRPWVQGASGRRYYARSMKKSYQLINYLIQGEAGVAFKRQMVALDRAGLDKMIIPVHDELVSDVPEGDVEEVRQLIAEVMPDRSTYRCPLDVEVSRPMLRWGEKYDGKEESPPPEEDEEEE